MIVTKEACFPQANHTYIPVFSSTGFPLYAWVEKAEHACTNGPEMVALSQSFIGALVVEKAEHECTNDPEMVALSQSFIGALVVEKAEHECMNGSDMVGQTQFSLVH